MPEAQRKDPSQGGSDYIDTRSQNELGKDCDQDIQAIKSALHNIGARCGEMTRIETLGQLLFDLRDVKQDVGRVYDEVELLYANEAPKKTEVPNIGVVEVKTHTRRTKWRHDGLIPVVVARALDERTLDEDGVYQEREAEIVARVLRECISFGQGKVTGLRARGIQVDEYCEEHEAVKSVVLPPAKPKALPEEAEAA